MRHETCPACGTESLVGIDDRREPLTDPDLRAELAGVRKRYSQLLAKYHAATGIAAE